MQNRINADNGIRGGNPNPVTSGTSAAQRGGTGSSGQNPASSAGFRAALDKVGSRPNTLAGQLPGKTDFAGRGFRKPNYFAQGARRHGMHIGSGAPVTMPADPTGADFGQ